MEVRARGSINPCQLENLRQGGVVKKKKNCRAYLYEWVSLCMYTISTARQPWDPCESLPPFPQVSPGLAMPARKGLLPADPASPPPRLPLCEKSRIPPAEMRKKNTTRSISFVASTISISPSLHSRSLRERFIAAISLPANELRIANAFLPFISLFPFGSACRIVHNKYHGKINKLCKVIRNH